MHAYVHDLSSLLPTFFPSGLSLPLLQGFATFKKLNQNASDSSLSGTLVFLPFGSHVLSTAEEQLSQDLLILHKFPPGANRPAWETAGKEEACVFPGHLIPSPQSLPSPQCRTPKPGEARTPPVWPASPGATPTAHFLCHRSPGSMSP